MLVFRKRVGPWLAAGGIVIAGLLIGFFAGWVPLHPTASPASRAPTGTPPPHATLAPQVGPYAGDLAPDFRLVALEGETVSLRAQRGHRVLINFFTTWCQPCRDEMPGLEAQAQKHASQGWTVLGVDIMEDRAAVAAFRDEFKLTFPLLLDEDANVTLQYLITGTPTSLFIDQDRQVVERHVGYMSEADIAASMERLP